MDRRSEVSWRVLVTLSLVLAVLFLTPLTSFGQTKPQPAPSTHTPPGTTVRDAEKDNPLERLEWQIRQFGNVTPAYRNKVLHEAVKHNQKMQRGSGPEGQMTAAERSAAGTVAPPSGPTWVNIGPFGADFEQNGSATYYERDSGRLRTILVHPTDGNLVYVLAATGGLWRTRNFEAENPTWEPLTDFLPTTAGGAVAFGRTPSTLYLGLGDPFDQITVGGSIVKSTDGGNTWSPMISLGNAFSVRDVAVDTSGPLDTVMVGTDSGLWRSTDGGLNYTEVTGPFAGQFIWSIQRTSAGWLMATQACGVGFRWCDGVGSMYLSTDHGANWTPITAGFSGAGRTTLAVGVPGDSTVYALAANTNGTLLPGQHDVYRSTDGGQTWTALGVNDTKIPTNPNGDNPNMDILHDQAWYNQMILVDPSDPLRNTVFIGGNLSSARTTDGGASWTLITNWIAGLPYVHADMHAAAYKSAGTPMVLFGTDGGIFFSTDKGDTWSSDKNNNLVTHQFYSISGSPFFPNFVMGGLQDNGTRVRSGNTGIFNQARGGDGFGTAMSQANTEASFLTVYNLSVRRDRTHGTPDNYTQTESSLSSRSDGGFYSPIYAPPASADPTGKVFFMYGAAGTTGKIYRTTNGGMSWAIVSTIGTTPGLPAGLAFRDDPYDFSVSPTNINHMAIGTNGGRVFTTVDGGANWTQRLGTSAVTGWPGFVSNVHFGDDNTLWVTSTSQAEGLAADGTRTVRVVKSIDGGATWVDASVGLPDVPVSKVITDPRDPSKTAYAATHVGMYRTTDGGASWAPFGIGLPNVRVNDMYMPPDGSSLRIATYGRGIWELSALEFVGVSITDDGVSCNRDGFLGNGETGHLTVKVKNQGSTALTAVTATITSSNTKLTFPSGTTIQIGSVAAHAEGSGSIPVALLGASGIETSDLTIALNDPGLGLAGAVNVKKTVALNLNVKQNVSTFSSFEPVVNGWTATGAVEKLGDVFNWERREMSPTHHTFAVTDSNGPAEASLVSPVVHVGTDPFGFSFSHRFSTEAYTTTVFFDGGVMDISTDNGNSWTPIAYASYPGTFYPGGGAGAFGYRNAAFPAFNTVTVDLGTAYANQDVRIRFRMISDDNTGAQGWEIDSGVQFTGITGTPFAAIVPHDEACGTNTSVTSAPNPANYGDTVAFAAQVLGGLAPATGNVVIKEGSTALGNASAANGQALINVTNLTPGTHKVMAYFEGDASHAPSTSIVYSQVVKSNPLVAAAPASLSFGQIRTGVASAVQTFTVTNTGTANLVVASIVASSDYAQTNDCTAPVAAGNFCTVSVTFTPTTVGARPGTITITHNAPVATNVVALTGVGIKPVVGLSKSSVDFASALVGVATAAQPITLTNTGSMVLTINSIAADGDFTQTNNCGATLAINASCLINVGFKATATGNRTGNVTISTDADGSPKLMALTGKGVDLLITGTTTATAKSGATATYNLTLTASNVFAGSVTLACSGAPLNATCTVAPSPVTLAANGTANVVVTVKTGTTTTASIANGQSVFAAFGVFGLLLLPLAFSKRNSGRYGKIVSMLIIAMVLTIAVGGMVACGGGSSTTPPPPPSTNVLPGTYPMIVTANSGSTVLQTSNLTLTVQ